jgi:hypothetical protein
VVGRPAAAAVRPEGCCWSKCPRDRCLGGRDCTPAVECFAQRENASAL